MKKFLFCLLAILSTLIAGCGEKSGGSISILDEISGVWRAKTDGAMISIIYADQKMRLLISDQALPISVGDIDNTDKTVNLNVTLGNGKPGVWTIRQTWDREHKSFHLQFTLHDGTQDELSFVRKISTDDLNKIANAEARNHPGSIRAAALPTDTHSVTQPTTVLPFITDFSVRRDK